MGSCLSSHPASQPQVQQQQGHTQYAPTSQLQPVKPSNQPIAQQHAGAQQQAAFNGPPAQPLQQAPTAQHYPSVNHQPPQAPAQAWQQPAQHATQPAASYATPQQQADAGLMGLVANKLNQIVAENNLQAFYPPQRLQQVMQRLAGVDLRQLATQWQLNLEIAIDLCSLALYDVIIYCDDSASMRSEDRINDLKNILERVATVVTLFDDDGINIRAFNHRAEGNGIRSAADADRWVQQLKYRSNTPLATEMTPRILKPFLYEPIRGRNLNKPILVVTITDGQPNEPFSFVAGVIKQAKDAAKNSPYGAGAIAFQFAQVGRDQGAQDFLGKLDTHPEIGAMVDATSYFELEAAEYQKRGVYLTPELWTVKLLVGAIDSSYDEQDE